MTRPAQAFAFFFHYGTVLWWRWIKTVPFFCARCCLFFFSSICCFFFLRVRGNVGSFVGWLLFDCWPIVPVFSACSVSVELLRVFRDESRFFLLTRSAKWPTDRESRPSSGCFRWQQAFPSCL